MCASVKWKKNEIYICIISYKLEFVLLLCIKYLYKTF